MSAHEPGPGHATGAARGRRRLRHALRPHLVALPLVALGLGVWWALPPRAPVATTPAAGMGPTAAADLPDLQSFTTRDGARLGVRVYPADADISQGKVSILTPIGTALLGLKAGQSIDWVANDGRSHRLTIVSVTAPEASAEQ